MRNTAANLAIKDIIASLTQVKLAAFLAWEDLRQRYVRTALGPLWIVLSTAIWIGVLGFVLSNLFGQQMHTYMPFLVSGILSWMLISTCIMESSQVMVGSAALITSFRIPIFIHYIRFIFRNVIFFMHSIIILVVVFCIYPTPLTANTWLVIPGILIDLVIVTGFAVFLSLANLRYRDTNLAVGSAMQVMPFVTPIYWQQEQLKNHIWVTEINPFYHMVEIMRAPMLGQNPAPLSWQVTIGVAIVVSILAVLLFMRYRHRIIFWL